MKLITKAELISIDESIAACGFIQLSKEVTEVHLSMNIFQNNFK